MIAATPSAPIAFDVYGLPRSGDAGSSPHKFCGSLGHSSDAETGLVYMRARYMDPNLGRFVSEDPARDGRNWYAYCDENPVNFTDRNGKFILEAIALVLTIVGIVTFIIGVYMFGCEVNRAFSSAIDWMKRVPDDTQQRWDNLRGVILKTQ